MGGEIIDVDVAGALSLPQETLFNVGAWRQSAAISKVTMKRPGAGKRQSDPNAGRCSCWSCSDVLRLFWHFVPNHLPPWPPVCCNLFIRPSLLPQLEPCSLLSATPLPFSYKWSSFGEQLLQLLPGSFLSFLYFPHPSLWSLCTSPCKSSTILFPKLLLFNV